MQHHVTGIEPPMPDRPATSDVLDSIESDSVVEAGTPFSFEINPSQHMRGPMGRPLVVGGLDGSWALSDGKPIQCATEAVCAEFAKALEGDAPFTAHFTHQKDVAGALQLERVAK